MLNVHVDQSEAGRVICRLIGELELSAVPQFRQSLADLPSGSRVLIDMSDVGFVDSAGLGALIGGVHRARDRGGDVVLGGTRPAFTRLLRAMGLDRLVIIAAGNEQAMAAP